MVAEGVAPVAVTPVELAEARRVGRGARLGIRWREAFPTAPCAGRSGCYAFCPAQASNTLQAPARVPKGVSWRLAPRTRVEVPKRTAWGARIVCAHKDLRERTSRPNFGRRRPWRHPLARHAPCFRSPGRCPFAEAVPVEATAPQQSVLARTMRRGACFSNSNLRQSGLSAPLAVPITAARRCQSPPRSSATATPRPPAWAVGRSARP